MVLRKKYQNVEIPDFNEFSELSSMERTYDQIIRRVSLDSSVESYKQYLIGGFMVSEWIATHWLHIDMLSHLIQLAIFPEQETQLP